MFHKEDIYHFITAHIIILKNNDYIESVHDNSSNHRHKMVILSTNLDFPFKPHN